MVITKHPHAGHTMLLGGGRSFESRRFGSDIGCCFGQDLRYMAADGVPTEKMYSSDIIPKLWDASYDLYRDADHMEAHFITTDILDWASPLMELRGKMDILIANLVFHLFDWERQVKTWSRSRDWKLY